MQKLHLFILLAALLIVIASPIPVLAHENNQLTNDHQEHEHDHEVAGGHEQTEVSFHIRLVGSQQNPPVTTHAFGRANVRLIENGTALQFRVTVCNIANVTMAHIHVGASGKNGPVILFLYHMHDPLFSSAHGCEILSSGTLHPSDLILSAVNGINNWTDFVNALLAGNTYVNVHTSVNPGGEIRGQLVTHLETDD